MQCKGTSNGARLINIDSSNCLYFRTSDGQMLIVSSTDGYCSCITFNDGELGSIYHPPQCATLNENKVLNSEETSFIAEQCANTIKSSTVDGKESKHTSIEDTVTKKPAQEVYTDLPSVSLFFNFK